MVRITGGQAKGVRLKVPPGARPTAERVRLAIFSMIGDIIEGAVVLDLFCGSGVLGIEALSRGAQFAVFVDRSRAAVECVKENLERTGFSERARVDQRGFVQGIKSLKNKIHFDVIFADPPYGHKGVKEVLRLASETAVLKEGGYLIIEHSRREIFPEEFLLLKRIKKRDFGGTTVSIYVKEGR